MEKTLNECLTYVLRDSGLNRAVPVTLRKCDTKQGLTNDCR